MHDSHTNGGGQASENWQPHIEENMKYTGIQDILFADACLVFIVTGIICAVVRWFHMCRPYDREEKYFYPVRRLVALGYLSMALFEIPYFLAPSDPATVIYVGIAGILFYPMCFASLFGKYFSTQHLNKIHNSAYVIATLALIVSLLITLVAGGGDWMVANKAWLKCAAGLTSLALTCILLKTTRRLNKRIDEYHLQNFSDEGDFPYRFAEKTLWMPLAWVAVVWAIFITGNGVVKLVIDLVLSVSMLMFLLLILHPQRLLPTEAVRKEGNRLDNITDELMHEALDEAEDIEEYESGITDAYGTDELAYDEEAKRQVLEIILRRFKEQHLQKKEVLAEVDKGKIAPASRFIASVGYYNLINMFRLEYARQYSEANPMVKQSAVAEASGFSSGSSFSKAKKNVTSIDRDFVSGVHL